MTTIIKAGDFVRSYDFPGLRADCYVEGLAIAADEKNVEILVERDVFEGELRVDGRARVTAPQNGRPALFSVSDETFGIRKLDDAEFIAILKRRVCGFESLEELLDAAGNYRPTIRCTREVNRYATERELAELLELADRYDQAQMLRLDPRRAYRG